MQSHADCSFAAGAAGAVGGDLDVQKVSPLFVPGAADVGAGAAAAKFPL